MLTTLVAVASAVAGSGQEAPTAIAVEATFLSKFAPFVEWPASAFRSSRSPLRICVVGDDELGMLARRAAAGQHLGDRDVIVDLLPVVHADEDCQILFAGGRRRAAIRDALGAVGGRPVLTVTDLAGEGSEQAMVRFVLREGRVRFVIDEGRTEASGMKISPEVLQLALQVVR